MLGHQVGDSGCPVAQVAQVGQLILRELQGQITLADPLALHCSAFLSCLQGCSLAAVTGITDTYMEYGVLTGTSKGTGRWNEDPTQY